MIIKSVSRLETEMKKQINKLEHICSKADGVKYLTDLDDSLNAHKEMNHTFLCYEDQNLIAFLHLFAPMSSEAELSALTLPDYRKKGYFTALLLRATEELNAFQVSDLLFVLQASFPDKTIAEHLGATYEFSEHLMSLNRSTYKRQPIDSKIVIKQQKMEHMEQLIDISVNCFHDSREDARNLIEMALLSANRRGFMAVLDDQIIGICYVRFDETEAFLFGFGVKAEYQGRGIGGAFLKLILNELFSGVISVVKLEVESRNASAFHVYKKTGFTADETIDYYRVHVKDL
ncbi:GNAT family N-acetyltransferase [Sporolactobacillus nakayamae]|uniref:Acetyltransferase (GNAT) family protein n=1 Tax=Sporolactobacillus nakayamae TaxID=269670 RepID=A0A1I2N3C4_9BACL|nr:GNAT family N-acetyltransferase [Sporolactobacillus nakayamae]SFF97610.1 Acetyltransferase (GNAT) family protein [Sporolactobacillus nakayamae]